MKLSLLNTIVKSITVGTVDSPWRQFLAVVTWKRIVPKWSSGDAGRSSWSIGSALFWCHILMKQEYREYWIFKYNGMGSHATQSQPIKLSVLHFKTMFQTDESFVY